MERTGFTVETVCSDARLRSRDGILSASALTITADAGKLAERIAQQARAEAEQVVLQAQADVLQQAAALLEGLERANATFLDRAQGVIVDLARKLFDRLVMESTPQQRVEASIKRILEEAPSNLIEPLLHVHPEDADLLPPVEWEVRKDPTLARGACRLTASNGEWHADFDVAAKALALAFADAARIDVADENVGKKTAIYEHFDENSDVNEES